METKRVKDIMIPLDKYPHVPSWFTIRQTMEEMEKSRIDFLGRKSLPRVVLVFDLDSRLHGFVRRRDILRALIPEFLAGKPLVYRKKLFDVKVDPNLAELSYDKMMRGMRDRAERPVDEVMIPVAETADYSDDIMKVIHKMVENDLSLLPVLREEEVVGVVRSADVFHELTRVLL